MTAHFDGAGSSYDQNYYNKLRGCFEKFNDTLLPRAQDQFWKGQIDFWLSNGTARDSEGNVDHWGQIKGDHCYREYHQGKTASMGGYNMTIYEPCNFASNIAFYRSTTKICDYADDWSIPEK